MKILGRTETDRYHKSFIVSISATELAHVMGYFSEYSDEVVKLKDGDTVKVDKAYDTLYKFDRSIEALERARDTLTDCLISAELQESGLGKKKEGE